MNLFAFLQGQQLGNGIAGREDLRPAVQDLAGLLPGLFPAPAVLELVEQIFYRPPAVIGQKNSGGAEAQVGAKDQPGLPQGAIRVLDLRPDNAYPLAIEKIGQDFSAAVMNRLPGAVEKELLRHDGQLRHSLRR